MRARLARSRKGYFFILDAFIAGIILFGAFILLLTRTSSAPATSQAYLTLDSFMDYCTRTQIRDVSHPSIDRMIGDGNITNPAITIFEQVAIFYDCGPPCEDQAQDLVEAIAQGNIPEQFGYVYEVNGTLIAGRADTTEAASTLVASQSAVTYLAKNLTHTIGPYETQVRVWTK